MNGCLILNDGRRSVKYLFCMAKSRETNVTQLVVQSCFCFDINSIVGNDNKKAFCISERMSRRGHSVDSELDGGQLKDAPDDKSGYTEPKPSLSVPECTLGKMSSGMTYLCEFVTAVLTLL